MFKIDIEYTLRRLFYIIPGWRLAVGGVLTAHYKICHATIWNAIGNL